MFSLSVVDIIIMFAYLLTSGGHFFWFCLLRNSSLLSYIVCMYYISMGRPDARDFSSINKVGMLGVIMKDFNEVGSFMKTVYYTNSINVVLAQS